MRQLFLRGSLDIESQKSVKVLKRTYIVCVVNAVSKGVCFRFLQVSLLFLLLAAAAFESIFNFHTQTQWGTSIFRMTAAALGVVMLLDHGISKNSLRSKALLFFGVALLIGLPFVYDFNPSHTWVEGGALVPREYFSFLPATVFDGALKGFVWSLVAGVAVLGTGARLRSRQVAQLLIVCGLLAFGITVGALSQRLTPRPFPVYEWTGCFVSHNHFTAFACLFFPVLCTLWIAFLQDARIQGRLSSPAPLLYLLAGLLCWAVILTGSRAGVGIILLQGLGLLVCLVGMKKSPDSQNKAAEIHEASPPTDRPVRLSGRRPVFFFVTGMVGVAAVWLAFIAIRGGIGGIGQDVLFRARVVMDTWSMIRERPWWGMGPGTFSVVFPYYQSEGLAARFFMHAHNEPVQIVAEWGFAGS